MTSVKELLEQESKNKKEQNQIQVSFEKEMDMILKDSSKNLKDITLLILNSDMINTITDKYPRLKNKLELLKQKITDLEFKDNKDFKMAITAILLRLIADDIDEQRGNGNNAR